jgi:signal transduction histidine kinase
VRSRPDPRRLPLWKRAVAGAALAGIAIALRVLLDKFATPQVHAFLFYYPAVVLAAMYFGVVGGLASIVASVISIAFIVPVSRWFDLSEPLDITDIGVFVSLALVVTYLLEGQRKARERAAAAQRQIEEYAGRLEREVAERARAEESLRQSHSDLEDLVHIVSHDLKEPLRGIAMTAAFLKEDHADKLPQDGKERIETLIRLPAKLGGMIDALLDYSRAWRGELRVERVDLSKVAAEVREALGPWLATQHAELDVKPLPTAACDRARVAQVLRNLITNGVKYNTSEPKRIEVGARDGAVYVKDNGIGIPEGQTPQIWRMFKRLHRGEEFGGGTGAGLALVKKTVERHGGRVWVESKVGEGSTFYFTLSAGGRAADEGVTSAAEVKTEGSVA